MFTAPDTHCMNAHRLASSHKTKTQKGETGKGDYKDVSCSGADQDRKGTFVKQKMTVWHEKSVRNCINFHHL